MCRIKHIDSGMNILCFGSWSVIWELLCCDMCFIGLFFLLFRRKYLSTLPNNLGIVLLLQSFEAPICGFAIAQSAMCLTEIYLKLFCDRGKIVMRYFQIITSQRQHVTTRIFYRRQIILCADAIDDRQIKRQNIMTNDGWALNKIKECGQHGFDRRLVCQHFIGDAGDFYAIKRNRRNGANQLWEATDRFSVFNS